MSNYSKKGSVKKAFRNIVFFPDLRLIGGWCVCGVVAYLGEVVLDSQERRVIMDD